MINCEVVKYLVVVWLLLVMVESGKSQNKNTSETTLPLPPYPKIRIRTSPSTGEEPQFNSPSFQWPSKKNASYNIRISSSKNFTDGIGEIF